MNTGLHIDIEKIEDNIILRLEGRIDAATAPILEKKINSLVKEKATILLDFGGVDYLSSAGMRLLLSETKKLKTSHGLLILFSVQDDVMEILKVAGFDRILNLCGTEEEALRFSPKKP